MRRLVIAIDGPAGAGKSTIARKLAEHLGFRHIDTGAMYRALALKRLKTDREAADLLEETNLSTEGWSTFLDGDDVSEAIRTPEVTLESSKVASIPEVRLWMVAKQRELIASSERGAVVEGRDIGTVVLPDADVKVYLTASVEERAARRAKETNSDINKVHEDVTTRDKRDAERAVSPMRPAKDAEIVDTTGLTPDEVVNLILGLCERIR